MFRYNYFLCFDSPSKSAVLFSGMSFSFLFIGMYAFQTNTQYHSFVRLCLVKLPPAIKDQKVQQLIPSEKTFSGKEKRSRKNENNFFLQVWSFFLFLFLFQFHKKKKKDKTLNKISFWTVADVASKSINLNYRVKVLGALK